MLLYIIASLALALWFGGGVVAGFVAPQAAFGVLTGDRVLAGTIAGIVLGHYATISVISGVVYVATWLLSRLTAHPWRRRTLLLVLLGMAVIVFSHLYVTPKIVALRSQFGPSGASPDLKGSFDQLHGLSVILFGIQWLLSCVALTFHARTRG